MRSGDLSCRLPRHSQACPTGKTPMSNVSRRLLVAPVTLTCIGFAVFAAVPLLTDHLHLATNSPTALVLHHVSGTWMILALAWLGGRCADLLLQRVALVSRDGVAYP